MASVRLTITRNYEFLLLHFFSRNCKCANSSITVCHVTDNVVQICLLLICLSFLSLQNHNIVYYQSYDE